MSFTHPGRNQVDDDSPWYVKTAKGSVVRLEPGTPQYAEAERREAAGLPVIVDVVKPDRQMPWWKRAIWWIWAPWDAFLFEDRRNRNKLVDQISSSAIDQTYLTINEHRQLGPRDFGWKPFGTCRMCKLENVKLDNYNRCRHCFPGLPPTPSGPNPGKPEMAGTGYRTMKRVPNLTRISNTGSFEEMMKVATEEYRRCHRIDDALWKELTR